MTSTKSTSRLRQDWADGWMADRAAIGLESLSPPVYVVVLLVVYQVVKLRHGCQDLTAERRRQSVDTHSNG